MVRSVGDRAWLANYDSTLIVVASLELDFLAFVADYANAKKIN